MADLQHYLLSSRGVTTLPLDKHLFFGRAEGNNFVVDDLRTSRRHAELYWDGSAFVLIDLDSSNGTRVNGEAISSAVLRDGDKFEIGLETFTYRAVSDPAALEDSSARWKSDTRRMATAEMPSLSRTLPDNDFSGSLSSTSLYEVCQLLHLSKRDGMLVVMNSDGEKAIFYFRGGQIIGAEQGHIEGEDAFYRVTDWRTGMFSFRSGGATLQNNISEDTTRLLLEAARRRDEAHGS
jgi:pSer/pThr/pTyr-binding forkhead associated (FHA) protein